MNVPWNQHHHHYKNESPLSHHHHHHYHHHYPLHHRHHHHHHHQVTCHHAVGGLLVAIVTRGYGVVQGRGSVAKSVAEGGGGEVHVGVLGGLHQGQARGYCGGGGSRMRQGGRQK